MPASLVSRRLLAAILWFLLWTLVGLCFASQFYISSLNAGRPISWGHAIGWSLADWYVWGVLAIPVFWLARRYHIEGPSFWARIAIHGCACAIASMVYAFVRALIGQWQTGLAGSPITFADAFSTLLVKTFFLNVIVYWVLVCIAHALDYYAQFRERERHTAELETSLAQAKLRALQMQLNPHFLFNTLHAISSLMHQDIDAADRMLVRLSDLLRHSLDSSEAHEVPLRQELDFLQRYLEIEQTRFGDRLTVRMNVAPETLGALVPNLLLQPLVENAIQHGIEPQSKPGEIEISAHRMNQQLVLEVRDNGVGIAQKKAERVGLSNTRSRLHQLYPGAHCFEMNAGDSGGLAVTATIPFRLARSAIELPS
jgi:signal transduction histidine kinase